MDFRTVITILTAFRVFTEVGTLILPLPVIWRLHIRTGKKFAISALFGLGLLSVCDFILISKNTNFTVYRTCLASIINAGYYLAWEPVAKTDPSILIGESTVLMGVLQ